MNSDSKRAILAVILSGLILFGWQYLFGTNQPYQVANNDSAPKVEEVNSSSNVSVNSKSSSNENSEKKSDIKISNYTITDGKSVYTINNKLQVSNVSGDLSKKPLDEILPEDKLRIKFKTSEDYEERIFSLAKESDSSYSLTSSDSAINGTARINEKGLLSFNFNSNQTFKVKYEFRAESVDSGSALAGFGQKEFIFLDKDLETFSTDSEDSGDAKIKWFGISHDFHFFGVVLREDSHYLYRLSEDGRMEVKTPRALNNFNFDLVFTQKSYDLLSDLGDNLQLAIDFGIWEIIAVPILRGLQFFFTLIPNYGFSVILLTILIRMLTFPLQYKSFKSMKKMQIIQPELAKIKEKFKDDPKRQQMETMALFKKSGANPIGGCLPMLLQMPVFFAFYKVLYSSIELVGAPFMLWITDLSVKDPYYVLPVLMGISMFFSQKLTPMTTTDPAQKKIMMFMPVIFSLMMVNLPAALTLYIFVSTLVGMLQQIFVFKRT